MNSLIDFVKALAPHIKKSTISRDLSATIKELESFTIPMVSQLATQAKVSPFKSNFHTVLESHIRDQVKFERKTNNLWLDIGTALDNVLINARHIEKCVEEVMEEEATRDGLNAHMANLLRAAGAVSFVSSYCLNLIDYAVVQESVQAGDVDETPPAIKEHIMKNISKFAMALSDTSVAPRDFAKIFDDVPRVQLHQSALSAVTAMFRPKQLDPFAKLGGVSNWASSPIFQLRMLWETYQAERYHAAKDRKAMLELRLLHLKNRLENNPSPRLQREIEGLEIRIKKYDRKIRDVEASVGL